MNSTEEAAWGSVFNDFFYTSLINETPCYQCQNPVKTINSVLCTLLREQGIYNTFVYFCSDQCKELYELNRG